MKRRVLAMMMAVIMVAGALTACSSGTSGNAPKETQSVPAGNAGDKEANTQSDAGSDKDTGNADDMSEATGTEGSAGAGDIKTGGVLKLVYTGTHR